MASDRLPPAAFETVTRRVMQCQADALVRVCERRPRTPCLGFLAAAYQSRTVREFLLTPPPAPNGPAAPAAAARLGERPLRDTGTFADAGWLASGLDARQSVTEHAMALDTVQALVEERLSAACPTLLRSAMMSPRTANFQQRFEVGVNETLLGAFPCALHAAAHARLGLRQGVLHVSTRHLCFEAALFAAAYTKLPLSRVASVEGCRDPLFHLIPNAIKLSLDDGSALTFASFQHRDEALALVSECVRTESSASC